MASRLKHRLDEVGGGGLALGAGYTHQRQPARGEAVNRGGRVGQRATSVAAEHHRPARWPVAGLAYADARRAGGNGAAQELVPIMLKPGQRKEDDPRPGLARIMGYAGIPPGHRRAAPLPARATSCPVGRSPHPRVYPSASPRPEQLVEPSVTTGIPR
ncbi:MAG: hypothetical protein MZU79_00895 [Anaerotruncus sp.]|nr:hypothetical protein [Anaerotruncus sp.]